MQGKERDKGSRKDNNEKRKESNQRNMPYLRNKNVQNRRVACFELII